MDIRTIQKPLAEFHTALSGDIRVEEIIVFGSYLEGNATEDSDIDVIVVSDDFKSMDEGRRLDLLYEKSLDIRPEIHPWGFTPEEIERASKLTTVGYARTAGVRFV